MVRVTRFAALARSCSRERLASRVIADRGLQRV